MAKPEAQPQNGKIDPRYILSATVDPAFKEAFIMAPRHLQFPTRNQFAFLKGIMGINPKKERVVVRTVTEYTVQTPGEGERPLTSADEEEIITAAKRLINNGAGEKPTKKITLEKALELMEEQVMYRVPISLHTPLGESQEMFLESLVRDKSAKDPETAVADAMLRDDLEAAMRIASLTPREKDVLRKRNGVYTGVSRTLDELGTEYGITRERIRQIEAKAYNKIRGNFAARRKLLGYLSQHK
ncbi:MAG: sigma factor-like helix-turn-helix DNA-binding protein [Candidatus Levyibacteriota bacterium]